MRDLDAVEVAVLVDVTVVGGGGVYVDGEDVLAVVGDGAVVGGDDGGIVVSSFFFSNFRAPNSISDFIADTTEARCGGSNAPDKNMMGSKPSRDTLNT